ncbi:UDP-glucose dehydrogenase family protein [Tumebacillus permanentifrigoris]|uniref:UDP-glucose 6-dehydrogenase n=1 Tax=Tumebacillus permanentifrigoris TaxID=378543 RepID=A0A316D683_9BACL|nr:UDP-glucose/GDP-mannose dehydrogenase family protein [Tumebacillus permanentifrigoris]PWK09693.1 UDPglucose 6-dehydrogenase [Tumebacillus permanentifrigoris]
MKIGVIGCGYVGLSTGVLWAVLGHDVVFLDEDERQIATLRQGEVPFYERGLQEVLARYRARTTYACGWSEWDADVDVAIIAVGTPAQPDGSPNLSYLQAAVQAVGDHWQAGRGTVVLLKSTLPPGTNALVHRWLQERLQFRGLSDQVTVVSNPEFLREGDALTDVFYPQRIIVGVQSRAGESLLRDLYRPLLTGPDTAPAVLQRPPGYTRPELFVTTPINAELIKYAANAFLAMKISFMNEFANLAERMGADILDIATGIGMDSRIGPQFLQAGVGWGGSCFGKDAAAILHTAEEQGVQLSLVQATVEANDRQRQIVLEKLHRHVPALQGAVIGVLGLSFKPGTEDVRDAPSQTIVRALRAAGAQVQAYDPMAMRTFAEANPDLAVAYTAQAADCFAGADAVLLLTEWPVFAELPWADLRAHMRGDLLLDGRNAWQGLSLSQHGYVYEGMGRGKIG